MFEKLLSVIPYSPGLIGQMAFYSRRMREEASIRRTGTVFLTLAFLLQFFAVLSPPQQTLAHPANSLVGGYTPQHPATKSDLRDTCNNNVSDYKVILKAYGIDCSDIIQGEYVTLHSNAQHGQYYSLGWHRVGEVNPDTKEKTNEQPVNINGIADPLWWKLLNSWDSYGGDGLAYESIKLHNSEGRTFYILRTCGNLAAIGVPNKVTPPKTVPIPPIKSPPPTTPITPPPPTVTPPPETPTPPPTTPPPPTPCPYNPLLPIDSPNCKPCEESKTIEDTTNCIKISKAAINMTTGGSDANNTTAKAGQVITYTLSVKNNGKADVKDYRFFEDLSDVLDYADVTNLYGGTINLNHVVSWPAQTIAAGQTATHQITVKVKDPIPATPKDPSDPVHFDLNMSNTFGDTVNIRVEAPPSKQIEGAAATLPNTGPGTGLMVAGAIVMIAGYLYSRAALLTRESEIAIKEVAGV